MSRRGWQCLATAARVAVRVCGVTPPAVVVARVGKAQISWPAAAAVAHRRLTTHANLWSTPTRHQQSTQTTPTSTAQDHAHQDVTGTSVRSAVAEAGSLQVEFGDESRAQYPYCWLRDNCQCPRCYDHTSYTRKLTLDDWDHHDHPTHVQVCGGAVVLQWASGHESHYEGQWLQRRAFNPPPRDVQRARLALKKELWGPDLQITSLDYEAILQEEEVLLQLLVAVERTGVARITKVPRAPRADLHIIHKIGFVKPTHYGTHYPISSKVGANSLAYTDQKLGMHNDLPYCQYVPGVIFLYCITQFTGEGGENDLADGFHVARYMRRHHPQEYQLLTHTRVYFWNKGSQLKEGETKDFYKLFNTPVIVLDGDGEVVRVNNSQLRDSYLDVAPHQVEPWYQALRLFNRVLQEQAIRIKLNNGEMLVMDNTRLLHGRTAYDGASGERHIDQVYMDWDGVLSKRRVLQEKYGVSLL